jgi:uncharacterized protein YndB with AHSA1/START domain
MGTQPFTIERVLNAPVEKVWQAITDRNKMKEWYFDLKEFKAEPGFEFSFYGGTEEHQYLHLCKIIEVVPFRKLSYTWKYEGYPGESKVTFELFPDGDKTRLKLIHEGLETFPADNQDFAKENFVQGWNQIVGVSLVEYIEEKPAGYSTPTQ